MSQLPPDIPPPPPDARRKYNAQKHGARRRGIPFLLDFADWWRWWADDNKWERRGSGRDRLCMARPGDRGAYTLGNILALTCAENSAAIDQDQRSAARRRAFLEGRWRGTWAGRRGDDHPSSRAVMTPRGRFGSASLAAEALGLPRPTAARWAREQRYGWRYEEV